MASPDRKELYKFNAFGQHLETIDAGTKAVRLRLDYDKARRLTKIESPAGQAVTIERDGQGIVQAIVSKGQRSVVTLDAGGYLETLTSPAKEQTRMVYSSGGLLKGLEISAARNPKE